MSLLIKNTSETENTFVNVIVYGDSGVGKTSLVKSLPESDTLVVSLEDGLLSLKGHKYDYVNAKTVAQVLEIVQSDAINKYKTVVIDSITELSQNTYLDLKKKYSDPKMAMKLWGDFSEQFSVLFKTLRRLEKNILAIALPRDKEDEAGVLIKKPDVYGKSSDRIIAWFDECFYMYVDKEGNRKLLTETSKNVQAKDRSGKLDKTIDADIGKVFGTILG